MIATTVRTRLLVAFGYVSVTIVVALTLPLALTLDRRARAEFERESIISANTIAQDVGAENLTPARRDALGAIVATAAAQVSGRVIVVDASGALLADSTGAAHLGSPYATPGRPEIVAALGDTPTSVIRPSVDLGTDIMATAVPIVDETRAGAPSVVGAVRITRSMDAVNENVRRVTLGVTAIGVGGLAAAVILAVAMSSSLSKPLRRLAEASHRFGTNDLSARVGPVAGPSEVRDLAATFDQMADRVEAGVRAQDEFVANASHQLRTPLTGMKLRLEAAIADEGDADVRAQLVAAEGEVDRLSAVVARLLALAAGAADEPATRIDLHELASAAEHRWRQTAREAGATIRVGGAPSFASVHAPDIAQILDNLLDNAIVHGAGPIEVVTGRTNGSAWITVRDHGAGIDDESAARATERFFRGAGPSPKGSGLGLAIVRQLAERDGGGVAVGPAEGGGALVEVRYPAANLNPSLVDGSVP